MPSRSARSEERRAQIHQAALTCFSRKGYHKTTMDDIVAESGLSKGSLYWYFKSKDDLFVSAVTSVLDQIGQEAVAGFEHDITASEKLRLGAQELVRFSKDAEGLLGLFVEFWVQTTHREKAQKAWTSLLTQYVEILSAIIDQGVQTGEFKPVDTLSLVWAIAAAYDGLALYGNLVPDLKVEQISQVFVDTLLHGLTADQQIGSEK